MTMLVREAMKNGLAIELFDGHKGTIELKHEGKWITFIVFMRKQKYEDVPFITVEIKNGKLCTALGHSNRRLTPVEKEFLEKYADKKGLEYTAYTRLTEA